MARSNAIPHPSNLFHIVAPRDYAAGEWLGSTSLVPSWLQQPFGITISSAAQHFRDGLLEIPPIFDDPPKWSAPGGTKIATRDRRAQSTSNWLSIAWHCGNRYINLLIEATPRPHVGCRRRNLLIEIGDGRPYIEAPVSHLRRGTKVNYCADTVSFHQHVVRENIEVHQGRRQAVRHDIEFRHYEFSQRRADVPNASQLVNEVHPVANATSIAFEIIRGQPGQVGFTVQLRR